MIITERTLTLRDGRTAVLRSPREADIPSLLELLRNVTEETDFLMRYPEETCEYTPELSRYSLKTSTVTPTMPWRCAWWTAAS